MKLILLGACGRMGKNVTEVCAEAGDEIVAGIDLISAPVPFPLYQSFETVTEQADVVIDFSSANKMEERLAYCKKHNLGIVLACTGISQSDEALIKRYAQEIPVFQTSNFSVGINLLQLLVKQAARILGNDFDAEIIEKHHNKKKDAPSGTALMLAESLNEGLGGDMDYVYGREGMVGERKPREIGIHAIRGGTIVGEHEILFAGEDELVTLSHSARSRKVFASGALKAARWLIGKPAGLYDMNDYLSSVIK